MVNATPKTLAEHLKSRRLELHLLQKQVAERFGVHVASIQNWEQGVSLPMIHQIPAIIEFLGFDPEAEQKALSDRIAYARRRLGMTQDDLAKALKVDSVSIWHWEKAHFEPPEKRIQQLQRLLDARQILIRL